MKEKGTRKKVEIKSKPERTQSHDFSPDDWISGETVKKKEEKTLSREKEDSKIKSVKMKRITFDISEDLHRKIKLSCVSRGINMADEMRKLLEASFSGV